MLCLFSRVQLSATPWTGVCQAPLTMGFSKQECGLPIPRVSGPKNQNTKEKQYCKKFIKDLKMVHIKKIFKKEIFKFIKMRVKYLLIICTQVLVHIL